MHPTRPPCPLRPRLLRRGGLLTLCLVLGLGGCGGGGGGAGGGNGGGTLPTTAADSFSGSFTPATVEVATIETFGETATFTAQLDVVNQRANLFFALDGDPALITDVTPVSSDPDRGRYVGRINFQANVAAGSYDTTLRIYACAETDPLCLQPIPGSPASLPVRLVVKPRIGVQEQVQLSRTGAEAAPSLRLPISLPPDAGQLTVTPLALSNSISSRLDGTTLVIDTTQARTGSYRAQFALHGSADVRYDRTVTVNYEVLAPAGGERQLSVSPGTVDSFLPQVDAVTTQTLVVSPPSWTSSPVTAQLLDSSGLYTLTPVAGRPEFQLAINPGGKPLGSYSASIVFDAGPTGGQISLPLRATVGSSIFPSDSFFLDIRAPSTLANLGVSLNVLSANGLTADWRASTTSPWLRLQPASGNTATSPTLNLALDPAALAGDELSLLGSYRLSAALPGSSPLDINVGGRNYLPLLQRGPAVLTGTAGRVYVDGVLAQSALLESGHLQVSGATLAQASYRRDNRFVGDELVLALDLTGASPGTPVTIRSTAPLLGSELQVAVQAAPRLAAAHHVLPFDRYRPARYAPGQAAFYFSSPGQAWRLGSDGSGPRSAALSGLSSLAVPPDELRLHATQGDHFLALDPVTLAEQARSPAVTDRFFSGGHPIEFDDSLAADLPLLTYAADGRAMAALRSVGTGLADTVRWPSWIRSPRQTRQWPELVSQPEVAEPAIHPLSTTGAAAGSVLVASPGQHAVVASNGVGSLAVYQASTAFWERWPRLQAGQVAVAMADDGQRLVASDGTLLTPSGSLGNLNTLLDLGQLAGGFGLSQDGRHGLIYAYRIHLGSGLAEQPQLLVVDLAGVPASGMAAASVITRLPLSQAVGCTVSPLASGETCLHTASISLSPGSGSAFVLGPRGLAVLALPDAVAVAAAAPTTRRALRVTPPQPALPGRQQHRWTGPTLPVH